MRRGSALHGVAQNELQPLAIRDARSIRMAEREWRVVIFKNSYETAG